MIESLGRAGTRVHVVQVDVARWSGPDGRLGPTCTHHSTGGRDRTRRWSPGRWPGGWARLESSLDRDGAQGRGRVEPPSLEHQTRSRVVRELRQHRVRHRVGRADGLCGRQRIPGGTGPGKKAGRTSGTSMHWGSWAGGGMAYNQSPAMRERLRRIGLRELRSDEALDLLDTVLKSGAPQAVAASVNWATYTRIRSGRSLPEQHGRLTRPGHRRGQRGVPGRLLAASPDERAIVAPGVRAAPPGGGRGNQRPRRDRGGNHLRRARCGLTPGSRPALGLARGLGVTLATTMVFDHPTVGAVVAHLDGLVKQLATERAGQRVRGWPRIESLGVALPARRMTMDEVVAGCRMRLDYPLATWTGIQAHRRAGQDEFAFDLARRAVETCLARSRYGAFRDRPRDQLQHLAGRRTRTFFLRTCHIESAGRSFRAEQRARLRRHQRLRRDVHRPGAGRRLPGQRSRGQRPGGERRVHHPSLRHGPTGYRALRRSRASVSHPW